MAVKCEPATQPTNVGVAGTTVTVPVPEFHRSKRVERVIVAQTSGDATSYDADVSAHSGVTALEKRIVKVTGGSASSPIDVDNGGYGYAWINEDGNVYVKITPNAGSNNNYTVRVLMGDK